MSITTRLTASLAATCLLLLTMVVSGSAYAVGIPGSDVPLSGSPFMLHNVKVRANRGSWTITASTGNAGFQYYDGSTLHSGTNGKFTLKATFDKNTGAFDTGELTIDGKIDSLSIESKPNDPLVEANITGFDFDAGYDDKLIGFKTDNLNCIAGLGPCTLSESVWVLLDAAFCYDDNGSQVCGDTTSKIKNTGKAITTLPLPAAVWLFGSGLVFMAATGRRRSAGSKKI